ncbi:hypothetical protein FACS189494_07420 [Spirochaetia bacterium]|nr:hypothetical protein FACS189494_07420 [Spirochaetia bacterium]
MVGFMNDKTGRRKLFTIILNTVSIFMLAGCVILLFPQIQQSILNFAEQKLHRELFDRERWINLIFYSDVVCIFLIIAINCFVLYMQGNTFIKNIFNWNIPGTTKQSSYFKQEMLGISGFLNFCRINKLLVVAGTIVLFFTYGVILFHTSIGIDTVLLTGNGRVTLNWLEIGRFGLVFLQNLWSIKEFNPYTAAFVSLFFLELSAIAWCYLIELFSKSDKRNYKLIPFAVLYISMPMWTECLYGLLQTAETLFCVFLCPIVIYSFYKGIFDNEKIRIIIGIVLLSFIASVYQGILPMFLCGVFICFILFQDNSNCEKALYRNVAVKLFIFCALSMVLYFLIDKIFFVHSEYLDQNIAWGKQSFIHSLAKIFTYSMDIFQVAGAHHDYRNMILFPATVLFIFQVIYNAEKNIQKDRLLYIFTGICIPVCIILFTIVSTNMPPMHAMYVLPLAAAFIPYYLLTKYNTVYSKLLAVIMLATGIFQTEVSVQIQYSDYVRYIDDIHIAYELDRMIRDEQDDAESLPIAFIANEIIRTPLNSISNANYLRGGAPGLSFREWVPVERLPFFKTLGINWTEANEAQINEARIYAENMRAYPHKGCVKRYNGIIVVKLSE